MLLQIKREIIIYLSHIERSVIIIPFFLLVSDSTPRRSSPDSLLNLQIDASNQGKDMITVIINPNHIGVKNSLIVLGDGGQVQPCYCFALLKVKKNIFLIVMQRHFSLNFASHGS